MNRVSEQLHASRELTADGLDGTVFVAFNGDTTHPDFEPGESPAFAGYCVEVKTQDHPELPGGGLQVGGIGESESKRAGRVARDRGTVEHGLERAGLHLN